MKTTNFAKLKQRFPEVEWTLDVLDSLQRQGALQIVGTPRGKEMMILNDQKLKAAIARLRLETMGEDEPADDPLVSNFDRWMDGARKLGEAAGKSLNAMAKFGDALKPKRRL